MGLRMGRGSRRNNGSCRFDVSDDLELGFEGRGFFFPSGLGCISSSACLSDVRFRGSRPELMMHFFLKIDIAEQGESLIEDDYTLWLFYLERSQSSDIIPSTCTTSEKYLSRTSNKGRPRNIII